MVGERDMQVRVRGTVKSYCTPFGFSRLVIPAMEWEMFLSQGVVGLGGSGTLGFFLFDCLGCFGMEISLGGWRKAVSRMAAPRGLTADHRWHISEGVVPGPSGDA